MQFSMHFLITFMYIHFEIFQIYLTSNNKQSPESF